MASEFHPYLAPTPAIDSSRRNASRPGRLTWIVLALCLAGVVGLRFLAAALDYAVVNIATLILVFIQLMTLLGWFCFRSGYSRRVRLLVPSLLVLALLPAIAFVRVDGTDGNLVPSFRWNWSKKPDQLLEPIAQESPETAIDLASESAGDFPGFLGPNRNASIEDRELEPDWANHPPQLLWKRPIGAGWSGFAAVNGYAVTMEQRDQQELVVCYDVGTGEPVWHHSITTRHATILGGVGPRSTPTIHEGRVYALGATGILRCLEGATGAEIWRFDLFQEFGTNKEQDEALVMWGRANSPLIVDDKVIVPAGGPPGKFVSLVACDKRTGNRIWEGGANQVSYASPVIATIGGREQIVSVNESNVTGHDPETGRQLWSHGFPGKSNGNASNSQPVILDGDKLFISKHYGEGAQLVQLTCGQDGNWTTSTIWHEPGVLKTKFTNVAFDGPLVMGLSDGILECVDWETGRTHWKSGRYGHGQILRVGRHLLVLSEDGQLSLVAIDSSRRRELGKVPVLEGQTWNTLCLFRNLLLVRNNQEAACYELALGSR